MYCLLSRTDGQQAVILVEGNIVQARHLVEPYDVRAAYARVAL